MKRFLTVALLLFHGNVLAQEVDWQKGLLTVTATAAVKEDSSDAYAHAEDAARLEAMALLLSAVNGVKVTHDTTLAQFASAHQVERRIEGFIADISIQGIPVFKKTGTTLEATVTMQLCIHNSSPECAQKKSVQAFVQTIAPPVKPVRDDKPCDASLSNEFADRPIEGIGSLAILLANIENYTINLSSLPFVVKYPDGKGGFCTLTSPATLDTRHYTDLLKEGHKYIFFDSLSVSSVIPNISIEIAAMTVNGKNEIIIDSIDGKYLNFIDKRTKGIFSKQGKVALVTKKAVGGL